MLGAAEAPVDADGVLRHAFVDAGPSGRPYPHLAVAALRAGGEAVHPRTALQVEASSERSSAWVRQGQLLIRFSGPPGHLRHVSYVDVLRGAVPAGQLAGRHLLVGMTAQGVGDTLATPVNGRQRAMPGVEVLAHTMDTLRRGDAVRALSPAAVGAVSAAGVLALVVTPEGLPLAYEVMPGNTQDKQTLKAFIAQLEALHGPADRIWIMDRGIPTEEQLTELRASDPPVRYLCLLYTSPSPRDRTRSRMPSSA